MLHTQYSRMTDLSEILTEIKNFLEDISTKIRKYLQPNIY